MKMHFNKGNKMKKAIIFDMDGVIFDTEPHYFQGYLTAYKNAKIESEIILHETSGRGKVKLSLYLTVLENIAQEQSIIQGD